MGEGAWLFHAICPYRHEICLCFMNYPHYFPFLWFHLSVLNTLHIEAFALLNFKQNQHIKYRQMVL